jgi:hypothetical protein
LPNDLQHTFKVFQHVIILESHYTVSASLQFLATQSVCLRINVVATVKLDHELSRWAGEIRDAPSDRILPAKLPG